MPAERTAQLVQSVVELLGAVADHGVGLGERGEHCSYRLDLCRALASEVRLPAGVVQE